MLQGVAQSACELVGTRYGSLDVLGGDQQLSQSITADLEPRALRLQDLGEHPLVRGFRASRPPMTSVLGVPIKVRGQMFGNLYLTEKIDGGDFTVEDENLAAALAAAAGVAIQNALLLEDSNSRRRWLEAGMEATDRLQAQPRSVMDNMALITEEALDASVSSLSLIAEVALDGRLKCRTSSGTPLVPCGQELPADLVAAEVFAFGVSRAVTDPRQVFDQVTAETLGPVLISALGTNSYGHHDDVLVLARPVGGTPYTEADITSSVLFASRIGLTLDLLKANEAKAENALFTDRDRIAKDLHDLVIQRLFAAGLSIQSLRRTTTDPHSLKRITIITTELDDCIRQLRDTIYSLRPRGPGKAFLSSRVLSVVHKVADATDFVPRVQFSGPVDDEISEEVLEQLLPVLQESVTNAIKHSGSKDIRVLLTVQNDAITLHVSDKGCGFYEPERISGLGNMRDRAHRLGGTCGIESIPDRGTTISWSVPVSR
ncbi:GAF domain-containing sensor histidine kinase [Pseudarthrobacter chlorophenolicus]|uniref:GAF domain-containing sensor histidine kinase n=1 Tax=Pseudarthrobacter chlorophenolicus TaxID=85085 RepID=UPI001FCAE01E|nr:GAF domain-containing sensor histidine kinase [Pseudarthrobacter chlorophenolicus]